MNDEAIMNALAETRKPNFIDHDAVFRAMTDEDYDSRLNGVSCSSFCNIYLPWIQYCNAQLKEVFMFSLPFHASGFLISIYVMPNYFQIFRNIF